MAVLSELRYPTTRLAKVFSGLLALILFAIVSVATISSYLLYQILKPARNPASLDLSTMMGHPTTFSFNLPDGTQREGWFFPGLRGAPTVVLSHGYTSQRSDVLTLVTALQEHDYNAFVFDYIGHGGTVGVTTLGYRETAELRAALQGLATRDDVDPKHFGLWGVDMGGYTTLEVASTDPRVAAFVVDSAYDDPQDLVRNEVSHSGLTVIPYVSQFCVFGFHMMDYQYRKEPPVSSHLVPTRGVPKLFIQSDDRPNLAADTVRIFTKAPEPKQMVDDRVGYRDMSDDDRRTYENRIVTFFLQNMPPSAQH